MPGNCKKCFGCDITYGVMELKDNDLYYPYYCHTCSHNGKEWYHLEFIESE